MNASPFPRLNPRLDIVFKMLFTRHEGLLRDMLEAVLGRPIASVELLNPELPPDIVLAKQIAMDLRVRTDDGSRADVEMQSAVPSGTRERFLYYSAREYSAQLKSGEDYSLLRPAISVIWLEQTLLPEIQRLHSVFELRERHSQVLYSSDLQIHLLQLANLAREGQDDRQVVRWARFLSAQSDTEYQALAQEDPIMAAAGDALEELSLDPEAQRLARERSDSEKLYKMSLLMTRQEALEEGRGAGERSLLSRVLTTKFGRLPEAAVARLEAASEEELLAWAERVFQAESIDDVLGQ